MIGALLLAAGVSAGQARNIIGGHSSSAQPHGSSANAAATSQTATAATEAAAQAAQAAVQARRAQDSLVRSSVAFQSIAAAQAAAHQAAINNAAIFIKSTDGTKTDGLGAGLLDPAGGVPGDDDSRRADRRPSAATVKRTSLSNGGTIALPKGTKGTDQVVLSGAGSVSGGTVNRDGPAA